MKPQLIKTIEEVQAVVPVNMTARFDKLSPFLLAAEMQFITRVIGKAQVEALQTFYSAPDPEKANMATAVEYCQLVIANLGYLIATPVLSLSISSSGIQVTSNQDTKQAFQWQVENLKTSLQTLGFNAIENLLQFLEENPEDFGPYLTSDEYKKQTQFLINTAEQFSEHYNINNSRFLFQAIAYLMKRVEDQVIAKLVGADFLNSLKAADLSGKKKYLVENYLRPALALITTAKAVTERVITLENGSAAYNYTGNYGTIKSTMPATRDQVSDVTTQLLEDGNIFLQDGLKFINDNLSDMTGFTPQVARRRFGVKNDPCKGVFIP